MRDGRPFPERRHLARSHVTGTTYGGLARLLLAVFDPTQARLGPGSAAQRTTPEHMRAVIWQLYGWH